MQYPTEIKLKLNLRYTQTVCHDLRKFTGTANFLFNFSSSAFYEMSSKTYSGTKILNTVFSFSCHLYIKGYY